MMNGWILVRGAALSVALLGMPLAASAGVGFSGAYAPAAASITTASNGSIYIGGAPGSITLFGGSVEDPLGDFGSDQLYAVTAAGTGAISFDWSWTSEDCCGAFFDSFGYRLNGGDFVPIVEYSGGDADLAQNGSFSLLVNAGDVFALDQNSFDDIGGAGTTVVTNFDGPVEGPVTGNGVPEPASWALLLSGFGGVGAILRRRRAGMACAA